MKIRNTFIIFVISALSCFAGTNIVTPILNGQLQSDLNAAATNSITNVLKLGFADGSSMTTASSGGGASRLATTGVKTANYNAVTNDFIPVDTTSGAVTVTFPTAPADKSQVGVKKINGGNLVNLALGGSDVFNKAGGAQTGSLYLTNQSAIWQYSSGPAIWYAVTGDTPLSALWNAPQTNGASITYTGSVLHNGGDTFSETTTWPNYGGPPNGLGFYNGSYQLSALTLGGSLSLTSGTLADSASSIPGTLPIAHGGTGQVTAAAGFSALANGNTGTSVTLNAGRLNGIFTYLPGGTLAGGPVFIADNSSGMGDSPFTFIAGPGSSGVPVNIGYLLTNVDGTSPFTVNYNGTGYTLVDPTITSWGVVSPLANDTNNYKDLGGTALWVANQVPEVIAHSSGNGNLAHLWMTSDKTNGDHVGIPYIGAWGGLSTNNHPYQMVYKSNSTNMYYYTNDALPLLVDVNQDTGVISNGINSTVIFGGTVVFGGTGISGGSIFSSNGAYSYMPTYTVSGGSITNGFFGTSGPGVEGFAMTGNSFGIQVRDGSTTIIVMGNSSDTVGDGGIFPRTDNTYDNGGTGLAWKKVTSYSLATLGTTTGTITATGFTNTLGTNIYINAIGTAVAVTIKNNAGTAVATNTVVTGGTIIPLQPGGSVSAVSGLTGTYWVQ